MNLENITIADILVLIAGVTTIVGFISKLTSPYSELKTRITKIEQHQDSDNIRLKQVENDTKMILKATRVLVEHSYTNNATGKLEKIKLDLDDYLINK